MNTSGRRMGMNFGGWSSGVGHTITANGDVANTRAQYKVGDSSIKFDGTGDYLSVPDSADWDVFGAGSHTVETWVKLTARSGGEHFFQQYQDANNKFQISHNPGSGTGIEYAIKYSSSWVVNSGYATGDTGLISDSNWHHVAIVKNGDDYTAYLDGTALDNTVTQSTTTTLSSVLYIGNNGASGGYVTGYMDEIRISDSARYTSSFTPSTTAFTGDANTKLLIHSDFDGGLGADSSGNKNDFAVTNLVATDQMIDTPTNNFATLNPLINSSGSPAYSEGNLDNSHQDGSNYSTSINLLYRLQVESGMQKYLVGDTNTFCGVSSADQSASAYGSYWDNTSADFIFLNNNNGNKIIDGSGYKLCMALAQQLVRLSESLLI